MRKRLRSLVALFLVANFSFSQADYESGDDLCPCLSQEDLAPLDPMDQNDPEIAASLGPSVNRTSYGVGCKQHDLSLPFCTTERCRGQENFLPQPPGCPDNLCNLNFCYVDPNNCQLLFRRSTTFPHSNRFFSYATCWDVDSFTSKRRISAVSEKVYKVGFNSNSGGWLGAYSASGNHFQGPATQWSGPTVDFAVQSAMRARFQINLTEPPIFLQNRSVSYFNSQSKFDLCVYATSLGYLDFCLSQYTITDQRAATTDWLLLGSQELFLVVPYEEQRKGWAGFMDAAWTIFSPFTTGAWVIIIFVVIPLLGSLMVFMNTIIQAVLILQEKMSLFIETMEVAKTKFKAVVSPYGDMWVGVSTSTSYRCCSRTMLLTIIAVYTANLAAILTQNALAASVNSLEDALGRNSRICSERKNLETIRSLFPAITDSNLAVDPVELGGDGRPGFNCPDCRARVRVFDFLDARKANSDSRYCHAAFAPSEDLEVMQSKGLHCNKTIVSSRLASVQMGIPVNEAKNPELISFFLAMKNDEVFDRQMLRNQPLPSCANIQSGNEEGEALNVGQLAGIWIVSGGFGLLGILVTWLQPKIEKRMKKRMHPVHYYDQMGHKTNILERDDDWKNENTVEKDGKLVFVGESRWEKVGLELGSAKGVLRALTKRIGKDHSSSTVTEPKSKNEDFRRIVQKHMALKHDIEKCDELSMTGIDECVESDISNKSHAFDKSSANNVSPNGNIHIISNEKPTRNYGGEMNTSPAAELVGELAGRFKNLDSF